jgi:hypothetical protein
MSYTSRITEEKQDDLKQELELLLEHAVRRSISHNEIVHIEFPGDRQTLICMLHDATDAAADIDELDFDIDWVETDGTIDVWAAPEDAETDGEMIWRLAVKCAA